MNAQAIAAQAEESAALLLLHAEQNQTSLIRYPVRKIEQQDFMVRLFFDVILTNTDELRVQIGNEIYPLTSYKISEFDPQTRSAKILCVGECLERLIQSKPSDVFLICDLSFLIKRVQDWYRKYGDQLRLPTKKPKVTPSICSALSHAPSPEQETAVYGTLTHPLSYVWGAPGTGKTQFVLTNCILNHLQQNGSSKILVLAPTNRAIEQVLYGILPNLHAAGIKERCVLRLGTPTKEFAEKYPEICEDHALIEKIEELNVFIEDAVAQRDLIHVQLKKYDRYRIYLDSKTRFFTLLPKAKKALSLKSELSEKKIHLNQKIKKITDSIQSASIIIQNSTDHVLREEEKITLLTRKIKQYSTSLFKKIFAFHLQKLEIQLTMSLERIEEHTAKAEQFSARLHQKKEELLVEKDALSALCDLEKDGDRIVAEFMDFCRSLHLLPKISLAKSEAESLDIAAEKGRQLFAEKETEYAGIETIDPHLSKQREEKLTQEIEQYRAAVKRCHETYETRMGECRVLACTLDCCIGRVQPGGDFTPDHIFLDEAGYSPLIKAAVLTAYNCPVTLLGDHMQLPPVCEIDDRKIEQDSYRSVCLWAQSALFLEELFTQDFDTLHKQYIEHRSPAFLKMVKYDLTHSFRFSSSLASILAGTVYSEKLQGSDDHETTIYYIDAPFRGEEKRTSRSECEAIRRFVLQHPEKEIGIITPYVNQRQLLKKMLPGFTEINTVHGAQGREWDWVILSVTDTSNKWFTDSLSNISNGKKVINTAVSRAKKALVIVCDHSYWSRQPRQLLGKLLCIAEKIPDQMDE